MVGPTASGKSELAMTLAERIDGIILSVDSMQVYRRMNIGTAKPSIEDRRRVRHEMVDLVEPDEEFSVAEFQRTAREVIEAGDGPVIIAGGSGLHFRAVVDPLAFPPSDSGVRAELEALEAGEMRARLLEIDPEAAKHLDMANPRRLIRALEVHRLTGLTPTERSKEAGRRRVKAYEPVYPFRAVGIDPGPAVEGRITRRLARMERAGLLDEVASLRHVLGRTASQAVGYKELIPVVDGEMSARDGFDGVAAATRSLVKRQRTYFRADPRIAWLDWDDSSAARVEAALASLELA